MGAGMLLILFHCYMYRVRELVLGFEAQILVCILFWYLIMPILILWWLEMVFLLLSKAPYAAHILLNIKQSPLAECQLCSFDCVDMLEFANIVLLCNQSLSYNLRTIIFLKSDSVTSPIHAWSVLLCFNIVVLALGQW